MNNDNKTSKTLIERMRIELFENLDDNGNSRKPPINVAVGGGAWYDFFSIYAPIIRKYARLNGAPPDIVEDMVQATVISLIKGLHSFKYEPRPGRFRRYLHTIVKRRLCDWRSSQKKNNVNDQEVVETLVDKNSKKACSSWDDLWKHNIIYQALRIVRDTKLKPITYEIFKLYVLENLPVNQVIDIISEHHNVHYNTNDIHQTKSRVIRYLRNALKDLLVQFNDNQFIDLDLGEYCRTRRTLAHDEPPEVMPNRLNIIREILVKSPISTSEKPQVLVKTRKENYWVKIEEPQMLVGAGNNCNLKVDDRFLSKTHCKFCIVEERWNIVDCESTNGVYVNGERIENHVLTDGDAIKIGDLMIYYFEATIAFEMEVGD